MLALLREYPRNSWEAYPGFRDKTRHWLGALQMFRRISELVRNETERYMDKNRDPMDFAARLSHYGGRLVGDLLGHHGWEDYSYFPELSAADPRFNAGLEILEKDHEELAVVLHSFTKSSDRTIQLIRMRDRKARNEAGRVHGLAEMIEAFLARHLSDEEELAVPIILLHRLRG